MSHAHEHGDSDDWGEMAEWYDGVVDRLEPELAKLSAAILDSVDAGPGKRILDVACGPGHTTEAARRRGADAVGLDNSPEMIDIARRRFPEASFVVGDMLDLPDGPWDGIVCRMGAHHVPLEWLAQANRTLRSGGVLALAEMDGAGGRDEQGMVGPDVWVARFQAAGFTKVTGTTLETDFAGLFATLPPELSEDAPMQDGAAFLVVGTKA